MSEDGDLFDVFDESEDEEQIATIQEQQTLRDPENGVLAFHGGTEKALLVFVKNNLSRKNANSTPSETLVRLMDLIDRFCFERHWMMNIGPEKGKTLGSFLDECLQANRTKNSDTFVFVELGTYCGYSCLRFLHRMLQVLEVGQFHIFTVDVEHETIRIAKEFVTMAGMQDCVTFLHLPETRLSGEAQQLSSMLLSNIQDQFPLLLKSIPVPQIDFLFIDHVKEAYLPDLKQLESKGFIQKGTYVAADNVLFHGIDDYRTHVGKLADQGIADSRLVEGSMEYVNDQTLLREHQLSQARDGIELTIYSKNPCSD